MCELEHPRWFFCLWKSPDSETSCAIQQGSTPAETVCRENQRIRMTPGMTNCDIEVEDARLVDHGSWMCSVMVLDGLAQAKNHVLLEVGRSASVRFEPSFGPQNELTVTEGETKAVRERKEKSKQKKIQSNSDKRDWSGDGPISLACQQVQLYGKIFDFDKFNFLISTYLIFRFRKLFS